MPEKNQAALDFLQTRRSRPAKTLTTPVPTREELEPILTAALRTPDHGKLEPWRLIVLERAALERLARLVGTRGAELGEDPDKIEKAKAQFGNAHLAVAVVSSPVVSEKVPEIEQVYSAGAVCLAAGGCCANGRRCRCGAGTRHPQTPGYIQQNGATPECDRGGRQDGNAGPRTSSWARHPALRRRAHQTCL